MRRLEPIDRDASPARFTRGKRRPRAVSWFGVRSFYGHFAHLIASAIASDNIDSRDWMHADPASRFLEQIANVVAPHNAQAHTLADALDREVWIDFVADTGDDADVSKAVAEMIFEPYELPDPENEGAFLAAPRGDLLVFGGDTAYPVASAIEIHERVIAPYNEVLSQRRDGKRRALLAIPGNHDWYDGLDGFARMFRKRIGDLSVDLESLPPPADGAPSQDRGARLSRIEYAFSLVEQFVVGGVVAKRKALVLDGYVPVQHASYFALPLAPKLDLWGVDRQLKTVDFRQRKFFARRRQEAPHAAHAVMIPDPVYAYLYPSPTGVATIKSLELDIEREKHFILCGDLHHYQRRDVGASTHVIAGGGGAFLHTPRIARHGITDLPKAEWPTVRTAKRLLLHVPLRFALGRGGTLPHIVLAIGYTTALGVGLRGSFDLSSPSGIIISVVIGLLVAVSAALTGDVRHRGHPLLLLLSVATGAITGFVPMLTRDVLRALVYGQLHFRFDQDLFSVFVLLVSVFVGVFLYGVFLMMLTFVGFEDAQAPATLSHPGFKHFLRMRVRRDGSAIDVWCIGRADPLGKDAKTGVVDRFTWRAP